MWSECTSMTTRKWSGRIHAHMRAHDADTRRVSLGRCRADATRAQHKTRGEGRTTVTSSSRRGGEEQGYRPWRQTQRW